MSATRLSGRPGCPPPSPRFGRPKAHKLPRCQSWKTWGLFLSRPYLRSIQSSWPSPECFVLQAPQIKRWPLAFSVLVLLANYDLISTGHCFQKTTDMGMRREGGPRGGGMYGPGSVWRMEGPGRNKKLVSAQRRFMLCKGVGVTIRKMSIRRCS